MLKQSTPPPLSVLEVQMDKIIKGHEMALNEAIIARHELQEIQASHEKHLQKRRRSRRQMATEEGFSIQEGQHLLESRNQREEARPTIAVEPAPEAEYYSTRAPPRCSDCHIIGHRRNQCPSRNRS